MAFHLELGQSSKNGTTWPSLDVMASAAIASPHSMTQRTFVCLNKTGSFRAHSEVLSSFINFSYYLSHLFFVTFSFLSDPDFTLGKELFLFVIVLLCFDYLMVLIRSRGDLWEAFFGIFMFY